jgi:hypothetical protein
MEQPNQTPNNNNNNNNNIVEKEKTELRMLIDRYHANNVKLQKVNEASRILRNEQNEIKEKLKIYMKKNSVTNIYTQDGGKIVYQKQKVNVPLNKKYFESKIIELLGEVKGKEILGKIINERQSVQREHITFRVGKEKSSLYV